MEEKNPELSVQSGAVDTHCHLFLMEVEPAVAVETAKASGVERLICVGVDVETSSRSLEIADALEGVFATAGVHPHDALAQGRSDPSVPHPHRSFERDGQTARRPYPGCVDGRHADPG